MNPDGPVRLCCGQPHWTVQCPDGLVMCCLCFDRFQVAGLNVTEDGIPENVCRGCAEDERKVMRERGLQGNRPDQL